jgi:16S rRNA (guanine527-N7)-methyltransferase
MPERIFRCFPDLSDVQKEKLAGLKPLYDKWNSQINVISRKDMDNFYTHHVLHSLSIAKVVKIIPGTSILDVGTGGGFPGIPLAILFPDSEFTLIDSIGKKIKVVKSVCTELGLKNVVPLRIRVEEEKSRYHYIVCRAVTAFPEFIKITRKNVISSRSGGKGIYYLKGGDLTEELAQFRNKVKIWNISDYFDDPFFETKKIVYLPV